MDSAADTDLWDWRLVLAMWLARWRLVALTTAIAVATALGLAALDPNTYQATALLAVASPDRGIELSDLGRDLNINPDVGGAPTTRFAAARAYAELVDTPGIAQLVLDHLNGSGGLHGVANLDQLMNHVRTRALAEGSLIAIDARATSPVDAARLANTWAQVFSNQMEAVLGGSGDVSKMRAARDAAKAALDAAGGTSRSAGVPSAASPDLPIPASPDLPIPASPDLLLPASPDATNAPTSAVSASRSTPAPPTSSPAAPIPASPVETGATLERRAAGERYLALARRVAELEVAQAAVRPELRVASPGVPPTGLDLGRFLRFGVAALVLGFLAGSGLALVWPSRPARSPRPTRSAGKP